MKVDTENIVPISEVSKRGFSRLVAEAESGRDLLFMRAGKPAAAMVSVERMDRLQRLEAAEEDLGLLALALVRSVTDNGNRTSLDDVLAGLGLTREELSEVDPDGADD